MKVLDASVMVDVLLATPRAARAIEHLDDDLFAPESLITEVHRVLQRAHRAGELTRRQVDTVAQVLHDSPIEFVPAWNMADLMWSWGDTISAFDADGTTFRHKTTNLFPRASQLETT